MASPSMRTAWFKLHTAKQAGLIFHSDRGRRYANKYFRDVRIWYGIQSSMGSKGDCLNNDSSQNAVRLAKGGAAGRVTLSHPAQGGGLNRWVAALPQPNTTARDASLDQPDPIRVKLVCGSSHASRSVARLRYMNFRGEVKLSGIGLLGGFTALF